MNLLRLALIVLLTIVLASLGILSCIIVPGGAAFMVLARLWARLLLRIGRVHTSALYHPDLNSSEPKVYFANHQSQFDIPAIIVTMPCDFRIVAKRELLLIPIFGWALWLAGFIFLDRGDRARAIRCLDTAATRVARGRSIVIFPEGTRSRDGTLLPFKKGGFVLALRAGVPVVPVTVQGGKDVLPKGSLRIRPGVIEVTFGAPIPTTSHSLDQKNLLIEAVRTEIAAGLRASRFS